MSDKPQLTPFMKSIVDALQSYKDIGVEKHFGRIGNGVDNTRDFQRQAAKKRAIKRHQYVQRRKSWRRRRQKAA